MKATGIIRSIDELGRIVVPKEMRTKLGIKNGDPVEITQEGDGIILRRYQEACLFCGSDVDTVTVLGKKICPHCLRILRGADDSLND